MDRMEVKFRCLSSNLDDNDDDDDDDDDDDGNNNHGDIEFNPKNNSKSSSSLSATLSNHLQPFLVTFPQGFRPHFIVERNDEDDDNSQRHNDNEERTKRKRSDSNDKTRRHQVESKFAAFQDRKKKKNVVLVGETERMRFQGRNFGIHDRPKGILERYLIAWYDEKTKEAIILNDNELHQFPYRMVQGIKGLEENDNQNENGENIENWQIDLRIEAEKRRDLIEKFGSGKTKRRMKSKQESKVDGSQVEGGKEVSKMLAEMAKKNIEAREKEAKSSKIDLSKSSTVYHSSADDQLMQNRRKLFPPFNLLADSPQEAYPKSGLITKTYSKILESAKDIVMHYLQDSSSPFFDTNEVISASLPLGRDDDNDGDDATDQVKKKRKTSKTSQFVKVMLQRFRETICNTASNASHILKAIENKIAFILYVQLLLRFRGLPMRLKSSDFVADRIGVSIPLAKEMLSSFTEKVSSSSFSRTKAADDRLMLYLLVSCLHACNFGMDDNIIGLISVDLEIESKNVKVFLLQLGCMRSKFTDPGKDNDKDDEGKSKKVRGKTEMVLKVPLKFPQPSKRLKKRP